ncbi:MAG: O-antigen ligase family protein [Gaiellaceae bacterium]
MSVASAPIRAAPAVRGLSATVVADFLLLATVFTITLANVRWSIGTADVNLSDILASVFIVAFLVSRVGTRDRAWPRTALVVTGFFLLFAAVYLAGYFNLETIGDRDQWSRGMVKFVIHFVFLIAAVVHLARRSERFYWRALGWFTAGLVANGLYGLVELGYAETVGGNLDRVVLTPIGSFKRGGINVFGAVDGADVFRPNALTLDPNHLGIMLMVPILTLLPIYLRLGRGHRLRVPLAVVLGFLALVELATLSRSGILGIAVGLAILALPYARRLISFRLLAPVAGLAAVVAIIVAQRADFFSQVFRARTSLGGNSTRIHLEIYDLLGPVIRDNPVFGLGLNTFSTYFEFITGRSNFGPHSYYVAVLTETGVIGGLAFLAWVTYLCLRLRLLHRVGRQLLSRGDESGTLVRPLAFGLTAALAGTLVANVFYLTIQFYYFFVLALFIVAAPLVFARRRPCAS